MSVKKVGNIQVVAIFTCVKLCQIIGVCGPKEMLKIKNKLCRLPYRRNRKKWL